LFACFQGDASQGVGVEQLNMSSIKKTNPIAFEQPTLWSLLSHISHACLSELTLLTALQMLTL